MTSGHLSASLLVSRFMIFLRSLIFNMVWYVNLVAQMVVQSPVYFFLSRQNALQVPKRWARTTHWFHRWIVGTKIEVTGLENLPEGGYIVASKHQSLWDFYSINEILPDSNFVLKSELMMIPFFGWYVGKLNHIPIRRGDRSRALRALMEDARDRIDQGRQILIFHEGTRRAPGDEPAYRYGITRMYSQLNCPVVPAALSSGLYWPRRKFLRYPGTIRLSFLEPIMPGLDAKTFAAELERRVEEECDRLYLESSRDEVKPPLSDKVLKRIEIAKEREAAAQGSDN